MNFLQSLLNLGKGVEHAAAQAIHGNPGGSPPNQQPSPALQTILGTAPTVTVQGHQFNYATPDVQIGPRAPYPMLNRGISFNGAASGLPDPSRFGIPLLNAGLGQSSWQFGSNSPRSSDPGFITSQQGVTIPYGGHAPTVDAPIVQPNIYHPAIATPAYYQPQQPPRISA